MGTLKTDEERRVCVDEFFRRLADGGDPPGLSAEGAAKFAWEAVMALRERRPSDTDGDLPALLTPDEALRQASDLRRTPIHECTDDDIEHVPGTAYARCTVCGDDTFPLEDEADVECLRVERDAALGEADTIRTHLTETIWLVAEAFGANRDCAACQKVVRHMDRRELGTRCSKHFGRIAGVERDRDSAAAAYADAKRELASLRERVEAVIEHKAVAFIDYKERETDPCVRVNDLRAVLDGEDERDARSRRAP